MFKEVQPNMANENWKGIPVCLLYVCFLFGIDNTKNIQAS